jgi:PAS domain S-box-containing protein
MTAFDLLVIAVVAFSLVAFARSGIYRQPSKSKFGPWLIIVGLLSFGLFYFIDLLVMHALPLFIPKAAAMAQMENLHYNLQWFFVLFGVLSIVFGFLKINQIQQILIREHEISTNALKESEAWFKAFIRSSPSAVVIRNLEGRNLIANQIFENWHAVDTDEIIGKTMVDFFPPELYEKIAAQEREVVESKKIVQIERLVTYPDGVTRNVFSQKFPILGADGECIAVGTIVSDLTEHKQME